jgi:LmbE family N-acetylglucosaminyl deacetylase
MLRLKLQRANESSCRILCLGAHCDDIEIGCGGTMLDFLERNENVSVKWVVFSSDEVRAREARECASAFLELARESDVLVKNHRDGFLPFLGHEIKEQFEEIKRDFDPDQVFTHYRDDRHQDHRLISDLTWNTFRNHFILEYEIPKYDGDLGQPNLFVPLEESTCSRKIKYLIECFQSQRRRPWFDERTFLALLRLRGMECNSPSFHAEAFYCRKAVLG